MKYDDTDLADRYDAARRLPERTVRLWLDAITALVSPADIGIILDVGCGTGRFAAALAQAFEADVVGVDPSRTMLARAAPHPRVHLLRGEAARLPVGDASAGLAFLSMVYHHIHSPKEAACELVRVLRPGGVLCVRETTLDVLDGIPYLKYFPAAAAYNRGRLPSRQALIDVMLGSGLGLLKHAVIEQEFADSPREYCDKISRRGLSDLRVLTDAEFEDGVRAMRASLSGDVPPGPVTEPVDFILFRKGKTT